MKPKALILTTTFPRWLNDHDPPFVYELAKKMTSSFEVLVHTPHYQGAKTREFLENVEVFRFRYFFEPFEKLAGNSGIVPTLKKNKLYLLVVPFLLGAQLISLFFLVLRFKPDVIHAHWILPQGLAAAIVHIFFRIPFVVTAHGADIFSLQGKFFNWLKCLVIHNAQAVSAVSQALALKINTICKFPLEKIHIMPMGVSSELFHPSARDKNLRVKWKIKGPFLLYVGRLSEKKGVSYLIEAMPKILQDFPDAFLLIIGHGELSDALSIQVNKLSLEQQVRFAGPILNRDLPPYFATADIFIGPSIQTQGGDTEGFGLTFVEAAMSGCLLIGSDAGGISDIITNNETGLLVPEKNSGKLAEKIIYALRNQDKIELIREKGRKRCIALFDWQKTADKYADLLLAICKKMH